MGGLRHVHRSIPIRSPNGSSAVSKTGIEPASRRGPGRTRSLARTAGSAEFHVRDPSREPDPGRWRRGSPRSPSGRECSWSVSTPCRSPGTGAGASCRSRLARGVQHPIGENLRSLRQECGDSPIDVVDRVHANRSLRAQECGHRLPEHREAPRFRNAAGISPWRPGSQLIGDVGNRQTEVVVEDEDGTLLGDSR